MKLTAVKSTLIWSKSKVDVEPFSKVCLITKPACSNDVPIKYSETAPDSSVIPVGRDFSSLTTVYTL